MLKPYIYLQRFSGVEKALYKDFQLTNLQTQFSKTYTTFSSCKTNFRQLAAPNPGNLRNLHPANLVGLSSCKLKLSSNLQAPLASSFQLASWSFPSTCKWNLTCQRSSTCSFNHVANPACRLFQLASSSYLSTCELNLPTFVNLQVERKLKISPTCKLNWTCPLSSTCKLKISLACKVNLPNFANFINSMQPQLSNFCQL